MPLKVSFDPVAIEARLNQLGAKVVRGGIAVMRDEGQKMAELAGEYAPRLGSPRGQIGGEGYLERAIKSAETAKGRAPDGTFVRKAVRIYIDPAAPGNPHGNMTVEEYGYLMHEGLGPFGDYTYGGQGLEVPWRKASAAKDGGTGRVGGKFIERAVNDLLDGAVARMVARMRREVK